MKTLLFSAAIAILIGGSPPRADAQCDEHELLHIPATGDQWGRYVDIGPNELISTINSPIYGSVAESYLRVPGGWGLGYAIIGFGLNDEFGAGLSISESSLVGIGGPGTPNSSGGTGRVLTFRSFGTTASSLQTIDPPTTLSYPIEDFGRSVSISENGEWMVVGAPKTFGDAGCIFLYRRIAGTWTFQQDVFLGTAPDQFGYSVAISGTTVIAGSPKFDGPAGQDTGGVFFYDLNTTTATLSQTNMHTGPSAGSELGTAVDIDDALSAAGGPTDDSFGIDSGSIFFYVNGNGAGGYGQLDGNLLGASVDIDNGNILVGRPGTDSVDRYKLNTSTNLVDYVETFSASPANIQPGEEFGRSVAIRGEACAVGAPRNASNGVDSGRVLTYEHIFDSTTTMNLGNALAGSQGAPSLNITGETCAGHIYNIALTNAAPSAPCALIAGVSAINSPFNGGLLVPAPNAVVLFTTSPSGTITIPAPWPIGLDALPLYFQWWISDATGPFGVTASNAVRTVPPGF